MRLIITDSGLGGLSVCAYLIKRLRSRYLPEDIDIKYINAVPEDNYGYNAMTSRTEKITTFNRFLTNVEKKYSPNKIFIACNSLSVIYPVTEFANQGTTTVNGIVEIGVDMLVKAYGKQTNPGIIIMATDTTVEEQTYARLLIKTGIPRNHIVSQACTDLANTISNDASGKIVRQLIRKYITNAQKKFVLSRDYYLVYLGCTHYGYRKEIFVEELVAAGLPNQVTNPNESAYHRLINTDHVGFPSSQSGKIRVEFITGYPIPDREISTLTGFLSPVSPETVRALQNFTLAKDLF